MNQISITRRGLLGSIAAAAIAPAASAAPAAPPPAVPEAFTLSPVPAKDWGYSIDGGEWWHTGFGSAEDALAVAREHSPESTVSVAVCDKRPLYWPNDFRTAIAEALGSDCDPCLWAVQHLTRLNQDNDLEGDFERDAEDRAVELDPILRIAIVAALRRAGAEEQAAALEASRHADLNIPDAALDAIAADLTLEAEVQEAVRAWSDRHHLSASLRTLDISEEAEHPPLEPGENAAEAAYG